MLQHLQSLIGTVKRGILKHRGNLEFQERKQIYIILPEVTGIGKGENINKVLLTNLTW